MKEVFLLLLLNVLSVNGACFIVMLLFDIFSSTGLSAFYWVEFLQFGETLLFWEFLNLICFSFYKNRTLALRRWLSLIFFMLSLPGSSMLIFGLSIFKLGIIKDGAKLLSDSSINFWISKADALFSKLYSSKMSIIYFSL